MRAIRVVELRRKIVKLTTDIGLEKNAKYKARLIEEQAAYKLVLRNCKQVEVIETR